MKNLSLILEITRNYARGVIYRSSFSGSSYENAATWYFESGDREQQENELVQFIKEKFQENSGIYLNVPVEYLLIRELELPFIDKARIRELVPLELESVVPYPIDEITYDYLSFPNEESGRSRVVVVAARTTLLEQYLLPFLRNQMLVRGLYISTDAVAALVPWVGKEKGSLLFQSELYSMFMVYRGDQWEYARIFPAGYERLFARLSDKYQGTFDEKKRLIGNIAMGSADDIDYAFYTKHYKLNKNQIKQIGSTVKDYAGSIAREVEASFDQFPEQGEEQGEAGGVTLVTDVDQQVSLENILVHYGEMEVEPFPYGTTPAAIIGREYIIPVGAAEAITRSVALDLMPEKLARLFRKKHRSYGNLSIIFTGIGVILLLLSILLNTLYSRRLYRAALVAQGQLYQSYFGNVPDLNRSVVEQAKSKVDQERKSSEIYVRFQNKYKLTTLLGALHGALMQGVYIEIDRISFEGNKLDLICNTSSFDSLENIKTQLETVKIFEKVEIEGEKSVPAKNGGNQVRFTLVITPAKIEL